MALRRSPRRLLAGVLLLLALPASAAAEQRVVDAPVSQVEFAGESLVYETFADKILDAYAVGGRHRLVLAEGRERRTLLTLRGGVDAEDEPTSVGFDWAVSGSALLYRHSSTVYHAADDESEVETRGGPLRGPYRPLDRCDFAPRFDWHPVAVSGDRGVYRTDCSDRGGAVVRNLIPPTTPPELTAPANGNVDLAGPYLSVEREATVEADEVAVMDTRDGRDIYEVSGPAQSHGGVVHSVQDDGKLAVHLPAGDDRCTLAWFSPTEPTPHLVGDSLCDTPLQIANDRIAYSRVRGGRQELVVHELVGGEMVIASAPRSGVSRFTSAGRSTLRRALAFDGTRTAYAVARCDGRATLLMRAAVAGPVRRDTAPLGCPLTVLSRSVRASSPRAERRVLVGVRCPRGCAGEARVGDSSIGQPFARGPGTGRVTLYLDDPTTDRLRRRGVTRVTVRISNFGRAGRETERRVTLTVLD